MSLSPGKSQLHLRCLWWTCRQHFAAVLAPLFVSCASCAAADLPASPPVGTCTDCIGEVNGTLNACTLSSASCVSSQNEDEDHFMAPWQYSNTIEAAINDLVAVATGEESQVYLYLP